MSLINKEISDFSAQAYQNGEFRTVTKQDVLGKWSLFFFYPADFTFVCPTELEDLQNKYAEFKAAGCEVYSVSTDTHFVHKAWHDHSERISKITYPMLADPTHALSRDFEVYIEEKRPCRARKLHCEPGGQDRSIRSQRRKRGPQCRRASPQASGQPVCGGARRPGLPRQVAARSRDPQAQP